MFIRIVVYFLDHKEASSKAVRPDHCSCFSLRSILSFPSPHSGDQLRSINASISLILQKLLLLTYRPDFLLFFLVKKGLKGLLDVSNHLEASSLRGYVFILLPYLTVSIINGLLFGYLLYN